MGFEEDNIRPALVVVTRRKERVLKGVNDREGGTTHKPAHYFGITKKKVK